MKQNLANLEALLHGENSTILEENERLSFQDGLQKLLEICES